MSFIDTNAKLGARFAGPAAFLVIGVTFWSMPSPFYYHPVLMSLGFGVLMSNGVLIAGFAGELPASEQRLSLLKKHVVVQVAANLCVLGGLAAIYRNKELHGKQHFTTLHAKMGLFVLALAVLSPLLGVLGFRSLGLTSYLPEPLVPKIKWAHRRVGLATLTLGCLTCAYGVIMVGRAGNPLLVLCTCFAVVPAGHIWLFQGRVRMDEEAVVEEGAALC